MKSRTNTGATAATTHTKRSSIIVKILAALTSGIVAFLIAELAMRLLDLPPAVSNTTRIGRITQNATIPGLSVQLKPHARGGHQFDSDPRGYFGPQCAVEYVINSFGARDREYDLLKPSGTYRILAIGDSFTFGAGVHLEDTFPKRLEQLLAQRESTTPYEVINLGVPRYSTKEEIALLSHVGLGLSPDLVLICVFLNDARGGSTLVAFRPHLDEEQSILCRYSRIYRAFRLATARKASIQRLIDSYRQSFSDDSSGWQEMQLQLADATALQDAHAFRLAIVIWPILYSLDESYPFREIHAKISHLARSLDVPVLDLLPHFMGKNARSLWVHPSNQHPNEIAHTIAARAIYDFLRTRNLLPE